MLAGCANVHSEEVVDCLRAKAFRVKLSKCGSNCSVEAIAWNIRVVFSIVTRSPRTTRLAGLTVTLDMEKSAEEGHHEEWSVSSCGFGEGCDLSSSEVLENGVQDSGCSDVGNNLHK